MRAGSRRAYALIVHDGRALLVRNRAGNWGLPGGRARRGEGPAAALKREVREEIGVTIKVGDRLTGRHARDHRGACRGCAVYAARIKKGRPASFAEITALHWIPLDEVPGRLTRFHTPTMSRTVSALA